MWTTHYLSKIIVWNEFVKNPKDDIKRAEVQWKAMFDPWWGPLNDACFQDGGRWNGDPVGALIPPNCVLE